MSEYQVVLVNAEMQLIEKCLVYADEKIALKEADKFNKMFRKHCAMNIKACVQIFDYYKESKRFNVIDAESKAAILSNVSLFTITSQYELVSMSTEDVLALETLKVNETRYIVDEDSTMIVERIA